MPTREEKKPNHEPPGWLQMRGSNGSEGFLRTTDAMPMAAAEKHAREIRNGVARIADERWRQLGGEGYTWAHDDVHEAGQLALAAACYAAPNRIYIERRSANGVGFHDPWPWDAAYDKRPHPSRGNYPEPERVTVDQRIRLLEKAGALCAAEIDRLLRLKAREAKGEAT